MTRILEKLRDRGYTRNSAARAIGVPPHDISHLDHDRKHKVSKKNRRTIYRWLVDQAIIIVKHRPKHECPICHKVHVISPASKANSTHGTPAPSLERDAACDVDILSTIGQAQVRNSNEPAQSQTVSKKSAA
jgi:hypothetical protein